MVACDVHVMGVGDANIDCHAGVCRPRMQARCSAAGHLIGATQLLPARSPTACIRYSSSLHSPHPGSLTTRPLDPPVSPKETKKPYQAGRRRSIFDSAFRGGGASGSKIQPPRAGKALASSQRRPAPYVVPCCYYTCVMCAVWCNPRWSRRMCRPSRPSHRAAPRPSALHSPLHPPPCTGHPTPCQDCRPTPAPLPHR